MDVDFDNSKLLKLYETGKSNKYKLANNLKETFVKKIMTLQNASNIYNLMEDKALHFEHLSSRKGSNDYSIRINNQYRLEFRIEWEDKSNNLVKKIWIIELSNHYE